MNNFPRYALAIVILLVALVFFGSVSCPPLAERETPVEEILQHQLQADSDTIKPLHDPLPLEDAVERENVASKPSFNSCTVTVRATDGLPLAQASVRIFVTDGSRESALVNGVTNTEGNLAIRWLPDGAYRMEVEHQVYFPAEPLELEMPSPTELHFDVALKIGARITGELRNPDGSLVYHGLVRFTNAEEQLKFTTKADAAGNFDSGPLVGGLWAVEWIPHTHATANPLLHFDAALAPGNHRRLRFTIGDAASAGNAAVGAIELFE